MIKNNDERKLFITLTPYPEAKCFELLILAGFLACPELKRLPIRRGRTVAKDLSIHKTEDLQLRVQLRFFTGFPFIISECYQK